MKLQEQLSRKVRGKKYRKYVMTIPPRHVKELGWEKGIELEVSVRDNKLVVQPKRDEESESSH